MTIWKPLEIDIIFMGQWPLMVGDHPFGHALVPWVVSTSHEPMGETSKKLAAEGPDGPMIDHGSLWCFLLQFAKWEIPIFFI